MLAPEPSDEFFLKIANENRESLLGRLSQTIHAYPNLATDMLALWRVRGDLTTAFRWLAHAGLDVDCNAGLVGTVLGVMHGAPGCLPGLGSGGTMDAVARKI